MRALHRSAQCQQTSAQCPHTEPSSARRLVHTSTHACTPTPGGRPPGFEVARPRQARHHGHNTSSTFHGHTIRNKKTIHYGHATHQVAGVEPGRDAVVFVAGGELRLAPRPPVLANVVQADLAVVGVLPAKWAHTSAHVSTRQHHASTRSSWGRCLQRGCTRATIETKKKARQHRTLTVGAHAQGQATHVTRTTQCPGVTAQYPAASTTRCACGGSAQGQVARSPGRWLQASTPRHGWQHAWRGGHERNR